MEENYPLELEHFHQTLSSLKGIENVCSGIDNLEGLGIAELKIIEYAHLPISDAPETLQPILEEVAKLDASLNTFIRLYSIPVTPHQ